MKDVAIGIDIGATYTKFGIVDENGNSIAADLISTAKYEEVDPFMKELHETIQRLIKSVDSELNVIGVGVGAPNGNYYTGTIEYAPNLKWKGLVPFCEISKKYYDMPTILTNDANAAAIGEMVYGGAKNMKNFIEITLGTGLGSGIVVNGELVYGHDGFAGELGHVTYDYNGRTCGCGRKGCLETYASATGIKRTVFELLASSTAPSNLRKYTFEELTAAMISKEAKKDDPIAKEAFEITGKILGLKLADTITHTSPEAIFLFGGLANAGDLIFEPTKRHMENHLMPIFKNKTQLLPSQLQEKNAAVAGASALIWKERKKL